MKEKEKKMDDQIGTAEVPVDTKQFISGFFDGDGCVYIPRDASSNPHHAPAVSFCQAYNSGMPPELLFVQLHYGGYITQVHEASGTVRTVWNLQIQSSKEVCRILRDLVQHSVSKQDEVQIALAYIDGNCRDFEHFHYRLREAKHDVEVDIDERRLTHAYIAGLFAADGSIGVYYDSRREANCRLESTIAQTSFHKLVQAIQRVLGFGTVSKNGILKFGEAHTIEFISRIQPFIVGQKKPQLKLASKFVSIKARKMRGRQSPGIEKKIKKIHKRMKKLKRM